MMKCSRISFEEIIQYIFMLSIVLTIFAPAVHYAGFTICFLMLAYSKICRLQTTLPPHYIDRRHIILITAFFLWSAFLNFPATSNFHTWGRGASVYLEMLLWYLMTIRLFNTATARKRYINVFVIATTVIFLMILGVYALKAFTFFHRLSMNLNTLGLYAMLAVPYFFYYSIWILHNIKVLGYVICVICIAVSVISFSSGAWLSIFFMLAIILYFMIANNKLSIKNIIYVLCLCVVMLSVVNYLTQGNLMKRMNIELSQMTAVNSLDSMTNHRYSIWRGTIKMITGRPISGYGRDSFDAEHERLLAKDEELAKATGVFDHAHNIYLELAFAGGIPSLILFFCFYMMLLKKCWEDRDMVEEGIPWNMIHFTLLIGMAVYGLTGDVFEARRDLAVIFWTALGIISVMPEKRADV